MWCEAAVAHDPLAAVKSLRRAAQAMRSLPRKCAEFYANGGAGVANPVVGDRFQGQGNARFVPLSAKYEATKAGQAKGLNNRQKTVWGRGSKLVPSASGRNLPILVRSGLLRSLVAFNRAHRIQAAGDDATVTFINLPEYAGYLHAGTTKMPKRSPVEPNEADVARVSEFASRWISGQIGVGSTTTAFGAGTARII